jgi:hypothetical protein
LPQITTKIACGAGGFISQKTAWTVVLCTKELFVTNVWIAIIAITAITAKTAKTARTANFAATVSDATTASAALVYAEDNSKFSINNIQRTITFAWSKKLKPQKDKITNKR